jgi:hypothetical protein
MVAVFVWTTPSPTDLTIPPQVNTWDTGADLPVIPAMADTVIETIGITETLIAIVRRVVSTRGTAIVTEGTTETGETAGVHPQPTEAAADTHLNIGAGEATQGARRGEEALVTTGSQTVRVVLASPQQMVQIHVGEVDTIAGDSRHCSDILKQSLSEQHLSKLDAPQDRQEYSVLSSLLSFSCPALPLRSVYPYC